MALVSSEPVSPALRAAPLKEQGTPTTSQDEAKAHAEEIRLRRGDISQMESPLSFVGSAPPGWTWRWVNDLGNNVAARLMDGWRFVSIERCPAAAGMQSLGKGNASVGDRIGIPTMADDKPCHTVLMEIPTEIAEEILEARSYSRVRAIEDAIRGGSLGVTSNAAYNPGERPGSMYFGIKNSVGRGAPN